MTRIDEGFLSRVYRTSAVVSAFGVMVAWSVAGPHAAIGWIVGSTISLGVLRGIEWFVGKTLRPGSERSGRALLLGALVHWPFLLALLAGAVWFGRGRFSYIVAFCAGLLLTQAVIVLKVVGMLVNQRFR